MCLLATAPHILIAEDNRPNRILIETYLHKFGFTSLAVDNGAVAVEAVSGGGFDLVLMDIQMPKMDGLTAARAIRDLPGVASDLPILALTASELSEIGPFCNAAGMDGVVCKPIDPADLYAKIARHTGLDTGQLAI